MASCAHDETNHPPTVREREGRSVEESRSLRIAQPFLCDTLCVEKASLPQSHMISLSSPLRDEEHKMRIDEASSHQRLLTAQVAEVAEPHQLRPLVEGISRYYKNRFHSISAEYL